MSDEAEIFGNDFADLSRCAKIWIHKPKFESRLKHMYFDLYLTILMSDEAETCGDRSGMILRTCRAVQKFESLGQNLNVGWKICIFAHTIPISVEAETSGDRSGTILRTCRGVQKFESLDQNLNQGQQWGIFTHISRSWCLMKLRSVWIGRTWFFRLVEVCKNLNAYAKIWI